MTVVILDQDLYIFLKILHYKDHSHSVWAFPSCGGTQLMNVYIQKGFKKKSCLKH